MPHYEVIGLDRESGEPRRMVLAADNETAAMKRSGLVIEKVKLTVAPTSSSSSSSKKKPEHLERDFYGLVLASTALWVAASICGALAGLGFVGGLIAIGTGGNPTGGVLILLWGVGALIVGLFFYALSEAITALRVIAINSFK